MIEGVKNGVSSSTSCPKIVVKLSCLIQVKTQNEEELEQVPNRK